MVFKETLYKLATQFTLLHIHLSLLNTPVALKCVSFFFLVLVLNSIVIHGRPFNIALQKPGVGDGEGTGGFFDALYLGAIKPSGPSPGDGHKFINAGTLGGIKDSGPAPGAGH